jgi:hypothetical protein
MIVWSEPSVSIVPKTESDEGRIAAAARNLSVRDQKQIVSAFHAESYEMMAGFVLTKALSQLKRSLSALGMAFVGEMLGRPDLTEDSVPTVSISNFEAVTLARELGLVNSTDAKRLIQHIELLAHFDSLDPEIAESEEMSREEALSFLRTCVNSILGRQGDVAPVEFVRFRADLESRVFRATDQDVLSLKMAPYFFKKTTLSILLSGIRAKNGAQFENLLGNIVVLVPELWPTLRDSEKWSVGQAYAEAVNFSIGAAVLALKKALSAVRGFDFVPESLRSQTFAAAAANLISVHTAMNNFYNEPQAIASLSKLGTAIPWPAFPICMSAVLAVRIGNSYGVSNDAQPDAVSLLRRITANQWLYYFNECIPGDQLILQKLAWSQATKTRWCTLVEEFGITEDGIRNPIVQKLVRASTAKSIPGVTVAAQSLLDQR